ncbi:MAG: preprotein translocase subunit SecE [Lachnospiraceae bacterium]|nr:preprotein translocase subunit SecE [Lachnospiraceae bacterium]
MSDTANTPVKTSRWKGLKAEWKKIIWPSRNTLVKESVAVVIITVILGLLIKIVDFGVDKLLGFIL